MEKENSNIKIDEMAQLGVNIGRKTSICHPRMKPFLEGSRGPIHIIDLNQTKDNLEKSLDFIKQLVSEDKVILFIGTKPQMKNLIRETAIECNCPYVVERWLGGTFTNYPIILKRIEYYKELEEKRDSKELEKYTKKEQSDFNKEISKLEVRFGGIKELKKLPDAIIIFSMEKDKLAVKEAIEKNIKIIGITNTNCDPSLADYPIPANSEAVSSIKYILDKIKKVILETKSKTENGK